MHQRFAVSEEPCAVPAVPRRHRGVSVVEVRERTMHCGHHDMRDGGLRRHVGIGWYERQWRNVREWRGHRVGGHEGERWHFGHGCRVFSLVRAERRVRRRSEMRRRVLCRERVVRHEWQRAEVPVRNPARVRRRLVVRLEPRQRAVRFRLLPDFVSAVTVVLARPLL